MNNWKAWLENLDIKPYSALGLFILLALPVTLMLVFQSQDNRSRATDLKSVTVSSIPALKTALADNTVDEIIVADGTYQVSPASRQASDSLWIGSDYAARTRPITVRAQTNGGVTFDGGGATTFGGISFEQGVHDQTWQGFKFANGTANQTGVIMFGGYDTMVGAHHITLRDITLDKTLKSATPYGYSHDHGIYFSWSIDGVHDILIDGLTVDGTALNSTALDSAVHVYHSKAGVPNAYNVTLRRLNVVGTDQAIILWDSTANNFTIEDSTFTDVAQIAIRYESPGSGNIVRRVTTINTGTKAFYSSLGENPPGITFIDSNFDGVPYGTQTPTPTPTSIPTPTKTLTPTNSPSATPSKTPTSTPAPSPKPTIAPTATKTPTPTPTPILFKITSGPSVITISDTQATVQWYLSSGGNGQVEYGKTVNYGSLSTLEPSFTNTMHAQILLNLTPGTIYHYRVKSTNQTGSTVTSPDNIFVTTGSITNPPSPTPTLKPTILPTANPTVYVTPSNTPTPILNPGRQKKCVQIIFWKFCF